MVVEQGIAHTLGHATYHAHDKASAGFLAAQRAQILQAAHDFLLGIVAYRACVEKYGIGEGDVVGEVIAGHLEYGGNDLRIGHVHLAAVSFYEEKRSGAVVRKLFFYLVFRHYP